MRGVHEDVVLTDEVFDVACEEMDVDPEEGRESVHGFVCFDDHFLLLLRSLELRLENLPTKTKTKPSNGKEKISEKASKKAQKRARQDFLLCVLLDGRECIDQIVFDLVDSIATWITRSPC